LFLAAFFFKGGVALPLKKTHILLSPKKNMISRVWYGWTTPANADAYESLLKSEIFVGIQNRQIRGYRGIQLFRRNLGDEVEFVTVMWFDSIEAVRAFAGEDYEKAVVPPKARTLLLRFDQRSQHYEVRAEMKN
jgi:heme-degrading monooxygenase HmoA